MGTSEETSRELENPVARSTATTPISRLLVPLDLSPTADDCLSTVASLALAADAEVTLLHVLESPAGASHEHPTSALAWQLRRCEARTHMEHALARLKQAGVKTKVRIAQGHAAEQILAEAFTAGADLTVLSRHGRSGESKWSIGSTAKKVIERARGSLLIVPVGKRDSIPPRVPPRRILIPLDGSIRAECALAIAHQIAAASGAEIILVHTVRDTHSPPRCHVASEDARLEEELAERWERNARAYLARIQCELKMSHKSVRSIVAQGRDAPKVIMDVAEKERADLVVMTAHGMTCNIQKSHGSVAEHLINYCNCPVLLVHDLINDDLAADSKQTSVPPVRHG